MLGMEDRRSLRLREDLVFFEVGWEIGMPNLSTATEADWVESDELSLIETERGCASKEEETGSGLEGMEDLRSLRLLVFLVPLDEGRIEMPYLSIATDDDSLDFDSSGMK